MFVLLLTAIVAIVYNGGPRLVFRALDRPAPDRARWLPIAATAAVVLAWFLPPVSLAPHSNTFLLHAVGGGISATLVAYHVSANLRLHRPALRAALALATVCVLGVANEILELVFDGLTGTRLSADASWDLVANTVGAMLAITVSELVLRLRTLARP